MSTPKVRLKIEYNLDEERMQRINNEMENEGYELSTIVLNDSCNSISVYKKVKQ